MLVRTLKYALKYYVECENTKYAIVVRRVLYNSCLIVNRGLHLNDWITGNSDYDRSTSFVNLILSFDNYRTIIPLSMHKYIYEMTC